MSFGSRLKEARCMRGLSMEALCQKSGITKPSMVRYERHDYMPMLRTIIVLAEALEMPIAFFTQDYERECETKRETPNGRTRETDGGGKV